MDDIIVVALPVFAVLMAAEFLYGLARGRNTYRFADTLASLGHGLLSQCIAVCSKLLQVGLYALLYEHAGWKAAAGFWGTALGWVLAIVLFDFFDYWLHRVGHERSIFWAAHAVHHQSEAFNFSTALRQESLVCVLGWPFYLPMALLGVPPQQFLAAGLIVLVYQFWIHTEHIGKLGWFDRVFSSPSNHRVHHALNPQYINKNYGGMLVVWDRLFGSFAEEDEPCIYGVQPRLDSADPLRGVVQGYLALAHDARRTRRWQDKLRIWWMPTGWRPADVAHLPLPGAASVDDAAPASSAVRSAAALLFVAMTGATAWLLWRADDLAWSQAALACAGIAASLAAMGALLDQRLRPATAIAVLAAALPAIAWALH